MTKTINWKKQRIERFKRENIKDDEDPDSLWKSPDKQTKVSFNETSPLPPNTQIIHQNCSVLNFYQLNAPNLHITSSTDDTKILQLKNAPVETYYPFQTEPSGLEELRKLQKLKDIVISTVSSSDSPREHTLCLEPELDRHHSSRLSPEFKHNQVQSNILSSESYTSKLSSLDTIANHVPRAEPLPTVENSSREVRYPQNARRSNRKTSTRAPRKR